MAIDSYTNLKSAIGDFLNRSDLATDQTDGSTVIEKFISLFESAMDRRLRVRSMISRTTFSASSQYTDLSSELTRFQDVYNLTLEPTSGGPTPLTYKTPEGMDHYRDERDGSTGEPLFYTIVGYELELGPVPDDTYTLAIAFYQKLNPLGDSNASNWLLASHPDLYLYGSLVHSAPYLRDDSRITVWSALMEQRIRELELQNERGAYPGTGLRMSIKRPYFSGSVTSPAYYR